MYKFVGVYFQNPLVGKYCVNTMPANHSGLRNKNGE